MAAIREAPGRPRVYELESGLPDISDQGIAYAGALLFEASDRLIDLIRGISPENLLFKPTPETPCIARFAFHMIWAEAVWISRLTGRPIPEELKEEVSPGNFVLRQGEEPAPIPDGTTSEELVGLCLSMRNEVTLPGLKSFKSLDDVVLEGTGPRTVRQVLAHITWHWTYHSGQVGLLRLQAGSDYTWCFA